MLRFLLLLFGQTLSQVGSGMTAFALGVWAFQQRDSVVDFSLVLFFTELPGILLSPITGALVDRWNRKLVLFLSDGLAALCTVALLPLALAGNLGLVHVFIYVAASALFRSLQWPAFSASLSWLVKKDDLGRAAGLMQASEAFSLLVAPLLGAFVLSVASMPAVLFADLAAFGIAATLLLALPLRKPEEGAASEPARERLWAEVASGWRFIRDREGLRNLLLHLAFLNFAGGITLALSVPLIMSLATEQAVGTINSLSALGLMAGGLAASMAPRLTGKRVKVIGAMSFVGGVASLMIGAYPSVHLVGAGLALASLGIGVVSAMSQTIWQLKVPAAIQGRVFALRRMVAWSSLPFAYLVAGPMVEYVGAPLAVIVGSGPGRAIAVIYLGLGFLVFAGTLVSLSSVRLKRLEHELPDAVT